MSTAVPLQSGRLIKPALWNNVTLHGGVSAPSHLSEGFCIMLKENQLNVIPGLYPMMFVL